LDKIQTAINLYARPNFSEVSKGRCYNRDKNKKFGLNISIPKIVFINLEKKDSERMFKNRTDKNELFVLILSLASTLIEVQNCCPSYSTGYVYQPPDLSFRLVHKQYLLLGSQVFLLLFITLTVLIH